MVESVTVFPGRLEVKVVGGPALHTLSSEVGLKGSENIQVGVARREPTRCTISFEELTGDSTRRMPVRGSL